MNAWDTFLDTSLRVYWSVKDRLKLSAILRLNEPPISALENRLVQAPMMAEVVEQSLILCEDYIYSRLAAAFLASADPSESGPGTGDASFRPGKMRPARGRQVPTDVSTDIQQMGGQLERSYPDLYRNVSAQIGMPFRSDVAVRRAMIYIGDFVLRRSVSWGRIVGLFAVAAAIATECVQNGRGNQIPVIVQVFSELIEKHAAAWICRQGGWVAIVKAVRSVREARYMWILTVLGAISGFVISWKLPVEYF